MIRILFFQLLIFLFPFALYGLYVKFQIARGKAEKDPWGRNALFWLVVSGLVLTGGGFVVLSSFRGEKPGVIYQPAVMKDGKIIPGQFVKPGQTKGR